MTSAAQVLDGSVPWALILGDGVDGLRALPDGCVDLVITDPPYGVSNIGMWHRGRPGKGKRRFDFFAGAADWPAIRALVRAAATECLRVARHPGSAYWWVGHREFGDVVEIYEQAGWTTRFLVWAKHAPSPPPPGSGWPSGAELCVYAWEPRRTWTHNGRHPPPPNVMRSDSWHGQPGKRAHPTQKPEGVIAPLILASSHEGDLVCDPFAGSGTAGAVALRYGRRFLGWEIEPAYHASACDRLHGRPAPIPGQERLFP